MSAYYPVPTILSTTVARKDGTMPIGISFADLEITKLSESSPLQGTSVQPGQTCLMINGRLVTSAKQAVGLIRGTSAGELVFTTCNLPAGTKMVSAAVSKHTGPGVNFDSTRGRTLVQISKVFKKGPFKDSSLVAGDIVLAVNGAPVSKPEDADLLLHQACNDHNCMVSIYVLNLNAFRSARLQEARAKLPRISDIHLTVTNVLNEPHKYRMASRDKHRAYIEFDTQTQMCSDPDAVSNLVAEPANYTGTYRHTVIPTIETWNTLLDNHFDALEDAVCEAAWRFKGSSAAIAVEVEVEVVRNPF
jgi:hypothetical protein